MGFRTPPSSSTAAAVATAAAGVPRVHVYESADGRGNPVGVVAFEDGVPGDVPATIIGGAVANLGGGALTFAGGSYQAAGRLVAAPTFDLAVDQGGVPIAELAGATGGLLVNGRRADRVGWTYNTLGDAVYSWPPAASWAIPPGGGPYAVRDLAAGEQLEVEFSMALGAALNAGSGLQLRLVFGYTPPGGAASSYAADAGYWSNSNTAAFAVPTRLGATIDGPIGAVSYQLQAQKVGNQPQNMQAGGLAVPFLRHRIVPN